MVVTSQRLARIRLVGTFAQNLAVKKLGSLTKLKAISWGSSGDRVRSKPEHREGWLSVEDQVRNSTHTVDFAGRTRTVGFWV